MLWDNTEFNSNAEDIFVINIKLSTLFVANAKHTM